MSLQHYDDVLPNEYWPNEYRDRLRGLSFHALDQTPQTIFVFSGQGSQWRAMGHGLLTEPPFAQTLSAWDQRIFSRLGWSVLEELQRDEADSRLPISWIAQPVVFSVQVALVTLLEHWGVVPDAIIGHSLGELAAAHAAGLLSSEHALHVLCCQNRILEQAAGQGKMLFAAQSAEDIMPWLRSYGDRIALAGTNSPKSCLLSGRDELLDLQHTLEQQGIFCRFLNLDIAFHSRYIAPYADEMEAAIGTLALQPAKCPVYSTVHGQRARAGDQNARYWAYSMTSTVRFVEAMNAVIADGYNHFIEISPHPVMAQAIEECAQAQGAAILSTGTLRRGKADQKELLFSVAMLHRSGYPIDWSRFTSDDRAAVESLLREPETLAPGYDPQARQRIDNAPPSTRLNLLKALVREAVETVSEHEIDSHLLSNESIGFLDLGFSSLMSLNLTRHLSALLQLSLPATTVFDYPNILALSQYLDVCCGGETPWQETAHLILVKPQGLSDEPIAVIGMSCRFPGGANDSDAYWDLLLNGRDVISEIPPDRWDVDAYFDPDPDTPGKTYSRWGGFLSGIGIDQFDARFFGISPKEARALDPQQRLLLEVSWEALENAGIAPRDLRGRPVGVFVGLSTDDYQSMHVWSGDPTRLDGYSVMGSLYCSAGGRLSYVLGLQGPNIAVDTACSSSLSALHLACQSLLRGESEAALVAGVNALLTPHFYIDFSKMRALSPTGHCKTFSDMADGYTRAEGCGVLVLKPLSRAQADGDRILALIPGSAVNQDGASSSMTAPNGLAQQAVMRNALAAADVDPLDLDYIEAHGTGTPLGDPIEVASLAQVYGPGRDQEHPLLIGSAKANIGHLEAGAGMAGLIKIILALQHQTLPPHRLVGELNTHIPWDEFPIRVPTVPVAWPTGGKPRLAAVSAFGFSGTNAHVLVAEAPDTQPQEPMTERDGRACSRYALALSARDDQALWDLATRYQAYFAHTRRSGIALSVPDLCYTANTGREHFDRRLLLSGTSAQAFETGLTAFLDGKDMPGLVAPLSPVRSPRTAQRATDVVFLFSGQGAQYAGMGQALYETHPLFRDTLDQCRDILGPLSGRSLSDLLYGADADHDRLNRTELTQPVLFAFEYALARLWMSWGIAPSALVGHSVGEYVAACLAGVFSLEDGLQLIAKRAQLMQSLPDIGSMAALWCSEDQAYAYLAPFKDRVALAAVNAAQSVVVSGDHQDVLALSKQAQSEGIRVVPLRVSHAFHSPLMEPILDEFAQAAASIRYAPPQLPVVCNVTGRLAADSDLLTPDYWCQHLRQTVRFADSIRTLAEQGHGVFLEIGPAPILTGLGRQSLPEALCLPALKKGEDDWASTLDALGKLYVHGVNIDWKAFESTGPHRKLALPTYPFQRECHWVEPLSPEKAKPQLHPLLDRMVRSPLIDSVLFETTYSPDRIPLLADHQVYGEVVVSGACLVAAILGAAEQAIGEGSICLSHVIFHQALCIPKGQARNVHIAITPQDDGRARVKLISLSEGKDDEGVTHVTCKLHVTDEPPMPLRDWEETSISAQWAPGEPEIGGEALYGLHRRRHIELGPSYRWLESIQVSSHHALGRIERPKGLGDTERYQLHPGLIDTGFGLLVMAMDVDVEESLVPFGMEQFQWHRRPSGSRFWGEARFRETAADNLLGDIHVTDDQGRLVAEIIGLQARQADRQMLLRGLHQDVGDWFYTPIWELQGCQGRQLKGHEPLPSALSDHLQSTMNTAMNQPQMTDHNAAIRQLNRLCCDWVLTAFQRLDTTFSVGDRFALDELMHQLGAIDRHRSYVDCLLSMLVREGLLTETDNGWEVHHLPTFSAPLAATRALIDVYPHLEAEASLVTRCGEALHEVLTGTCDPVNELLFPQGDMTSTARVYRDSPGMRLVQDLLRDTLQTHIRHTPPRRGLRVLEIGAGTGSTTAELLPHLPADRVEYVFTDVSTAFLHVAQTTFADYPFVDYARLDIEQDATAQGLVPHSFDIIIAANVLHATRQLRESLTHIRSLLVPGGLLLLLEGTASQSWIDLIFGMTEGWWRFTDWDIRPDHPLLSSQGWQDLLSVCGYQHPMVITCDADRRHAINQQALVIAQASALQPVDVAEHLGHWLLFADDNGLGQHLAEDLRQAGASVSLVTPGKTFSRNQDGVQIDSDNLQDYRRLFADLAADGVSLRGIVHLWSLNTSSDVDPVTEPREIHLPGWESSLDLFQAVASHSLPHPPKLWWVTRGAMAVDDEALTGLTQAPLWGMVKSLAWEHPEFAPVLVDLDPQGYQDEVAALIDELFSEQGENQVALRGASRHVARLVPRDRAHGATAVAPDVQWSDNRTYLITGGLGGLGLETGQWMVEQGARHLALVGRRHPTTAIENRLSKLREFGADIRFIQADVTQAEAVAQLLAELARTMPPLGGIIHAAGTLDNGPLLEQTPARFEHVLAPKVLGAWYLHHLTRDDPLDFFVMYSSVASLLGPAGQANYAAANAFLDALAHYRRAQGLAGLSLNWGAWSEVGIVARESEGQLLKIRGVETLSPDQGLTALHHVVGTTEAQVGVVPIDWPTILPHIPQTPFFSHFQTQATAALETERSFQEELAASPVEERRALLEGHTIAQINHVLGLSPSEHFEPGAGFFDIGMDSLTSVELRNRLQTMLGCSLSLTLAFDFPNLNALVSHLATLVLDPMESGSPQEPGTDSTSPIRNGSAAIELPDVRQLDQLSESEAEDMLLKELEELDL
uniref:Polyketide synthase n=1 Tax=Candidatus Entotheonella serta TaxID=1652106 RepID=A0A2P1AM86_9BACT|nr:polyketide synthase [Candidatus Entotheonella serta]